MKTVIVYASRHHGNTKKLVEAIAKAHAVDVIDADLQQTADLKNYDRIGFASGVAFGKYYPPLLTFMEKNLPAGKEVFFFTRPETRKKSITPQQKPGGGKGLHDTRHLLLQRIRYVRPV